MVLCPESSDPLCFPIRCSSSRAHYSLFISLPVVYTEHVSTAWVPSPHYRQVVWGMFLHVCSRVDAQARLLQCVDRHTDPLARWKVQRFFRRRISVVSHRESHFSLLVRHYIFKARTLGKLVGEMVLSVCLTGITQARHLFIFMGQAGFSHDMTVRNHCFPIGWFSPFLLKHISHCCEIEDV